METLTKRNQFKQINQSNALCYMAIHPIYPGYTWGLKSSQVKSIKKKTNTVKRETKTQKHKNVTLEGVFFWLRLEFPVCINGLDSPFELLTQGLGEELLNGHVESLGEDRSQARVDVVLRS